ncbi:Predicted lipocalin [Fructobacillus cardui]|uniref:hypothetical protein n=1 Tax=Fructobacillus cardui TaxID=2893170 RepID=UPI002DA2D5DB|nr:Predicted lipocalin [Fructobacillus cardui]
MADGRVMNTAADFEKFGVNPKKVENWEDGRRDNDEPDHGEIWYIDCSFDDKTTLVLGFRPKSTDQVNKKGFNPNIAMNYNTKTGEPFNDYRLYKAEDVYNSDESADLKWGENTLKGHDWQSYDVHIEPEDDYEVEFEGKNQFNTKQRWTFILKLKQHHSDQETATSPLVPTMNIITTLSV